jgi:hypothetical protein
LQLGPWPRKHRRLARQLPRKKSQPKVQTVLFTRQGMFSRPHHMPPDTQVHRSAALASSLLSTLPKVEMTWTCQSAVVCNTLVAVRRGWYADEICDSVKLANTVTFDRYVSICLITPLSRCSPTGWIERQIRCQESSLGQ